MAAEGLKNAGLNLKQALDIVAEMDVRLKSIEKRLGIVLQQHQTNTEKLEALASVTEPKDIEKFNNYTKTLEGKITDINTKITELGNLKSEIANLTGKITTSDSNQQKTVQLITELKQQLEAVATEVKEIQNCSKFVLKVDYEKFTSEYAAMKGTSEKITKELTEMQNFTKQCILNADLMPIKTAINEMQALKDQFITKKDIQQIQQELADYKATQAKELLKVQESQKNATIIQELQKKITERDEVVTNLDKQVKLITDKFMGLTTRMKSIEDSEGVSIGEEIATGLDSAGIFRKLASDHLGSKASQLVAKDIDVNPVNAIDSLINVIREASFCTGDKPNAVEILLKYSEKAGVSDKSTLILSYATDIRKILEAGQTVLAGIGKEKAKTRGILEETKNLTRKWRNDTDIENPENGVPKVIELLHDLITVFKK